MQPTQLDQPVAVGTKSGHFGPSEDYGGSQKGLFGRNWALLGVPGVSKRSLKGPEHMI